MEANSLHPMNDLLRATEGVRNGKAVTLLIAGAVGAVAILVLGASTQSAAVGLMAMLLALVCAGVAYSAAGVVLMAAARQAEAPGWSEAVAAGAFAFGKMILVALLALAAGLLYWLLLSAVFFVCKTPFLGPLLYALALPLAVIATALLSVFAYVAFSLLFPALWQGLSVRGAVAQMLTVASQRAGEVVLKLLLLSLLLAVFFFVMLAFLGSATLSVTALSLGVIGSGGGMGGEYGGVGMGGGLEGLVMGAMMGAGGSGHMYAGMFGLGVVWGIASAAWMSVFVLGINLIYLSAAEGLDASGTESMLAQRLEQAKRKAGEFKQQAAQAAHEVQARARQAQERAQQAAAARAAQASAAAAASATAAPPAIGTCPGCHAAVGPEDAFCGSCGARLK